MAKAKAWRNRIIGHGDEAPDQLLANPKNWRVHPKGQQDALAGVLNDVGWVQSVIVNKRTGYVVDGHLRVQMAISHGDASIPVTYVDLDDAEEAEILATLDPLAALAVADKEQLDGLLREVQSGETAVQGMLAELAEKSGLHYGDETPAPDAQIDKAAELQEKWQTALGQVWQVGEHRIACGDCTDAAVVTCLLDGQVPNICVTDPPYGVEYEANWRNEAAAAGHLAYADRRVREVANDTRIDWADAWRLFPGNVLYCWHADRHASTVQQTIESTGFEVRCQIIWAKSNFPISRGHYHWRHEPCWYAVRKGAAASWIGDHKQTTLWEINLDQNVDGGHSTQKPLACMERPIINHAGDVYDPFVGSGTTMVAAERQKRRCFACDVDPAYVAVCLERLSMMGLTPTLVT